MNTYAGEWRKPLDKTTEGTSDCQIVKSASHNDTVEAFDSAEAVAWVIVVTGRPLATRIEWVTRGDTIDDPVGGVGGVLKQLNSENSFHGYAERKTYLSGSDIFWDWKRTDENLQNLECSRNFLIEHRNMISLCKILPEILLKLNLELY